MTTNIKSEFLLHGWILNWRLTGPRLNDFREVGALAWHPAEPETGIRSGYVSSVSKVSRALMQSGELGWWEVFGLRFICSAIVRLPIGLETEIGVPSFRFG